MAGNLLSYPEIEYKIDVIPEGPIISCDTETTGLNPYKGDKPFMYQFANMAGDVSIVFPSPETKDILKTFFANDKITKVFHNMKFDIKMIRKAKFDIKGRLHDTFLMAKDVDTYAWSFKLENLIKKYDPSFEALELAALDKWFEDNKISKKKRKYYEVPPEIINPYGAVDAYNTSQLYQILKTPIKTMIPMYGMDMKTQEYLIEIEDTGVKIDKEKAKENIAKLKEKFTTLQQTIKSSTGMVLEPSGGRPLAAALFAAGETCIKVSPESKEAVLDKITLPKYKAEFIPDFLEMKRTDKLIKDIRDQIIGNLDKKHILHTSFNLSQARTGRFSSSGPNLQNQTKDDILRAIFINKPEFTNFYFDYKQIEYRLFAHFSGDKASVKGFHDPDFDIHQMTADKVKRTRSEAKTINFLILYGGGAPSLSEKFDIPENEAAKIIKTFHDKTPALKKLDAKLKEELFHNGYIEDPFGRQYCIPKDESRKCVNYLIQGTACNVFKKALLKVKDLLVDYKSNVIQLIHDEIVFEIADGEWDLLPKIKALMEDMPEFDVPLPVDVEYTLTNWANKQSMSEEEVNTIWLPFENYSALTLELRNAVFPTMKMENLKAAV